MQGPIPDGVAPAEPPTGPPAPSPVTVAKGVGLAILAGLGSLAGGTLVVVVARGGLAFLDRLDLLTPAEADLWWWRAVGLVAIVATSVVVWVGGRLVAPGAPRSHAWLGVVAGAAAGGGFALVGSGLWATTAIGVGWAVATAIPDLGRVLVRAAPPLAAGFVGFTVSPSSLPAAVVTGVAAAIVAAVIIVSVVALEHAVE